MQPQTADKPGGRPTGGQLDAQFPQLGHHGARVGPFAVVEAVVAHYGPVEEVGHDHR